MDEPHGASGAIVPNHAARRVLASGLVLLCAYWSAAAFAAEPGVLRPLPPVTDTYQPCGAPPPNPATAPPMQFPAVLADQPPATFLYGFETADPAAPFAAQNVGYFSADPAPGDPVPAVAMRTNQSILQFSGMQDPSAPQPPGEEGAASESPNGGDDAQAEGEGKKKENGEPQTYGQAPTNNSVQFLRQVDVLLKPGKAQLDTGFVYTHFANDFPLPLYSGGPEVTNVVEAEVRRRLLYTPLAVRYGLSKNMQLFASLPAGFSDTQISTAGLSVTQNVSGIGDLTAGASFHLLRGEDLMPDVIGTFGFTAPTGKFNAPVFGLVPGSNLGQGFWALSGQLLFINRYDPVIVFYGGGYRHLFERSFDGVLFAPGEQVNYMFGAGFSVNDRVTLSSTFQGYYITNSFINGVNLRGSNLEPMSLRFSITVVRDCRIIEPFVQIGVTDSAPRANLGVVVTFY
jgi:Putative MetA-pathway of phenol degradation